MNNPTITTILQTYKRPQYLAEQLLTIEKQSMLSDKLIIVMNEGGYNFDTPDNAQVIYAMPNMKFHLRFAIGLLATSDYVAFFDDDTLPGENWYKNCIDTINKHDCICVTNGRIVDRSKKQQYGPGWSNPSDQEVEVDFGGHAWFLKRKNLKYMWYEDPLFLDNGEDIQLSANCKRFGNIPSFVPPHPVSDKSLWGSNPDKAMKYGSDGVASWIVNPTHNQERFDLFDKYVEKGWKLLLEQEILQ